MARIGYLHEAVGEESTLRPLALPDPDDADLLALCRDNWKLHMLICRARNQFSQLVALVFPELKTFFSGSVSTAAPVGLLAAYHSPAELGEATSESVAQVLHRVRAYEHANPVAELQELARHSAGLLADPGRAWRLAWLTDFLLDNFEAQATLEKRIRELLAQRSDYAMAPAAITAAATRKATISPNRPAINPQATAPAA